MSSAQFDESHISKADLKALSRVPPELRPCKIIYFYARRLMQEKLVPDWHAAISKLAEELGLSEVRAAQICNGVAPTSSEIDRICKRKRWSILFVFAVGEEALRIRREQYFTVIGVENPKKKQRREFDELYARLLKLQTPNKHKEVL